MSFMDFFKFRRNNRRKYLDENSTSVIVNEKVENCLESTENYNGEKSCRENITPVTINKKVTNNLEEKKYFSSDELIQAASSWTNDFIQSAPKLASSTYKKDEIYMFCCWILLDYGTHYGYLTESTPNETFWESIFQAVRNTGEYEQTEFEQFMFRVKQYKWQMREMLKCDYPETKMFFPETLYARFVHIDFNHYHPDPTGIDMNLIKFSEYLGKFWNKVNYELVTKFPKNPLNKKQI